MLWRQQSNKKKQNFSPCNTTWASSLRRRQQQQFESFRMRLYCSMMTRWVLERGDRNRRLSQLKMRRGEKERERKKKKEGNVWKETGPDGQPRIEVNGTRVPATCRRSSSRQIAAQSRNAVRPSLSRPCVSRLGAFRCAQEELMQPAQIEWLHIRREINLRAEWG